MIDARPGHCKGPFPLLQLLVVLLLCGTSCLTVQAQRSPEEWAQARLDYVRKQKVQRLHEYCNRVHDLAQRAAEDEAVVRFFRLNLEYGRATAQGDVPLRLQKSVAEIREGFNQYYIENYLTFYDFLLVDLQGNVFYTLRKENDLNGNLMGDDTDSPLAQCLTDQPSGEVFLDFREYGPSGEPAAFFVLPVQQDDTHLGWLILQCSINKINMLFAWASELGSTGETFLVNQAGYMLTESNFKGSSTILRQRLDDRNIQPKFADKEGHRVVTDYRGFAAMTSFEVVSFMGTHWLVVAKIDCDEVLTDHYMQHRWYYEERVKDYLVAQHLSPSSSSGAVSSTCGALRVDMDELIRAESGQQLETFGVSTCTGFLGTVPGRFSYLAHISPQDKVYGGTGTDLLRQVVMRIQTFDVRPCEIREVSFSIVAPHLNSLSRIVKALVEHGFLLSQIRVFHHPKACSARISYDCGSDELVIRWQMKDGTEECMNHKCGGVLFSDVIREIIAHDDRNDPTSIYPKRIETEALVTLQKE